MATLQRACIAPYYYILDHNGKAVENNVYLLNELPKTLSRLAFINAEILN